MADMVDVQTSNNTEKNRYEAYQGVTLAGFVEDQETSELVVLTHTEVDPAFEGQGIGGALARAAMDDVHERELKALIICPFINSWIARHPEYVDVLYGAPQSRVTGQHCHHSRPPRSVESP